MKISDLRDQINQRISALYLEEDRAKIALGQCIGAREELEGLLKALEGVGDEPTPITEDSLAPFPPEITCIESPNE